MCSIKDNIFIMPKNNCTKYIQFSNVLLCEGKLIGTKSMFLGEGREGGFLEGREGEFLEGREGGGMKEGGCEEGRKEKGKGEQEGGK